MLEILNHARRLSHLLKQPFETPAEAMVRMHEASIIIDRLVRKLEEPKSTRKSVHARTIDADIISETDINPHEIDETDIAEELDKYIKHNPQFD
jgi:hypothetical protein